MRALLVAVVLLGCAPGPAAPPRVVPVPTEFSCDLRTLPTRVVASCQGLGTLPPRPTLVLSFLGPAGGSARFVPAKLAAEKSPLIRRHDNGPSVRIDLIIEDACMVKAQSLTCVLPAEIPAWMSARIRPDENFTALDVHLGVRIDDELSLMRVLPKSEPELLARVNARIADDRLHATCAAGDGDACVTLSELAWSGPLEWSAVPAPILPLPPPAVAPTTAPTAPVMVQPPPEPVTVSVVQPTPTCEAGSRAVCDDECARGRFRSCLMASPAIRARFGPKTAETAWPALVARCEKLRAGKPSLDDPHAKPWRLSCTASLGILDEAIDLLTASDDVRLVKLSTLVETHCGDCN